MTSDSGSTVVASDAGLSALRVALEWGVSVSVAILLGGESTHPRPLD